MSLYVAPLSQLCSLPSVTVALHSPTEYNMWWVKAVFILFTTVLADFDADLLKLSEEFDSPGNVIQPVFIVNIANIYFRYSVQLFVSISLYFRYISDGLSTYLLFLSSYFPACFVHKSA